MRLQEQRVSPVFNSTSSLFFVTYPHFRLYDDGFFVLFRHQHAGGERRLDHVDDQIIGQNVQLLHLVACHVGAASDAVTDET